MAALRYLLYLLLGAVYVTLPLPLVAATGCYKNDGSTSHSNEWPCDPDADTSLCCGAADYCLGSVLCMDTGSDNKLSLQGCTNSSWPEACNPICPGTTSSTGYIYVQQCYSSSGTTEMCCGSDYTCCNGTDLYSMDVFTAISKAPGATSTSTSTSTSVTGSSVAGSTGTSASTASASATSSGAGGGSSGSDDTKDLAIGLGVGIPMGLAVIGSLVFVGMQMRNKNKQAARAPTTQKQAQPEVPMQPFHDQGNSGGGGWQIYPYQQNHQGHGFVVTQAPIPGELDGNVAAQELSAR